MALDVQSDLRLPEDTVGRGSSEATRDGWMRWSEQRTESAASCAPQSPFSPPDSPQSTTATSISYSPASERPALLDMDTVHDLAALDCLLAQFESSSPELSQYLPELLAKPLLLELVLAATDGLATCIRVAFPPNPHGLPGALNGHYPSLVARLADVPLLPLLALAFDRDTNHGLDRCRNDMLAALDALKALADASFAPGSGRRASNASPDDEEPSEFPFARARQKQGSKKRAQRAAAASCKSALDPKPFRELGVDIPNSQVAADRVALRILSILERCVKYVLARLKIPDCVAALKTAYIKSGEPEAVEIPQNVVQVVEQPQAADPVIVDPASTLATESIRTALYFDSVEELGPWRILISSRADRNLRELRRGDAKMFKIVLKKIRELSFGQFSDDNQKRLTGKDTAVPIYEAKMTRDTRLVYRIDCIPEYGTKEEEHQVLCLYGIYTHAQLERGDFWTSAGLQLACKGVEYRRRCIYRSAPVNKNDKVYAPAVFPLRSAQDDKDTNADIQGIAIPQEDLDELHALLVLEKFVVFSQALLNSIVADIDVTHPFNPSPQEKSIIEHPYSCYVMGRSGTGKTTTMLFKMLGRERAWRMQRETMRKPRQLFVTQSRMLAGKVEDYFRKLLDSLEVSDYKPKDLKNCEPVGAKKETPRPDDLLDVDDDDSYGADLPQRFSQLEDRQFPLFTTFEKLSQLIEADVDVWQQSFAVSSPKYSPVVAKGRTNVKRALVTYPVFQSRYWPHFPENLTKGLDPALVYSEIMGVIKGSEESLHHDKMYLDQDTYENFSTRRQATFASERSRVYALFSAYERRRIEEGHTDVADRTHAIIKALYNDKSIMGQRIDFLYVDEAQDNLLIDAMLLRTICSNPRGLFWAGDTAQTISVGSSFRFNDLRAFLHRVEEKHAADLGAVTTATTSTNDPPALFQLLVNYRSHGGIISCAQTVISLLSRFWPDSIDNLAEERGVVDGVKPVFFGNWDSSTVRYEQFLFGSGNEIEFGARQCIIVRSEEAQTKLRSEVGEIGVIMTVYESKGLEFDDVLLYNFFEDSTVTINQWRVVLNALSEGDTDLAAPRFDAIRHAGVCSELKSLYVAITRARKNMWIIDRSEKGEPMRAVWTSRDLVQNCTPDTDVPHLAVSSTQAEWEEQARTLFKHKRYLQARHCFERAGQPQKAAVADAYYLRSCAILKPVTTSRRFQDERADAFVIAAHAFRSCAMATDSNARERQGYFRRAGELFEEAGKAHFTEAAKCFEHGEQYIRAAKLYREVGDFDNAVRIVQKNGLVDNQDGARIITSAKLFYFNREDIQKGCLLFDEPEEAIEYLEDRGLDVAQAAVLETMGRWSAAAEVHLQEGRTLAAAEAYLRDEDPQSGILAREVIMRALWEQIAFGRAPRPEDPNVVRLGTLISHLRARGLDGGVIDEINFFETLLDQKVLAVRKYAASLRTRKWNGSERMTGGLLLALHIYFTKGRWTPGADLPSLVQRLDMMLVYVRLLRDHITRSGAIADPLVQLLFGFRVHSERRFILLPDTHLHREVRARRMAPGTLDEVLIMEDELTIVFRKSLLDLILQKVKELEELRNERRALAEPCLQLILNGICTKVACPREHIAHDKFTAGYYNQRVFAHVLALSILAALDGVIPRWMVVRQERYWSSMLYEALRPVTCLMGNTGLLDLPRLVPHGSRTCDILHSWVRPHLYELQAGRQNVYTYVMQCAWISQAFNPDHNAAGTIMYNAPVVGFQGGVRTGDSEEAPLLLTAMLNATLAPSTEKRCFLQGIDFLSCVLERGVSVDIGVLCDSFEDLLACLITSWHLGSTTSTALLALPGGRKFPTKSRTPVTLPRSWLMSALQRRMANRLTSMEHLKNLVTFGQRFIRLILESRQSPSFLWYRGQKLSDVSGFMQNIFIDRICFGLCLLGYNFDMPGLHKSITEAMRSLPNRSGNVYESYATAQNWRELANIAQQYLAGSQLDCMLCVIRRGGGHRRHLPRIANVTNVIFTSFDDLSKRLSAIIPGQPEAPSVRQLQNVSSSAVPTPAPEESKMPVPAETSSKETAPSAMVDEPASDSESEGEVPDRDEEAPETVIAAVDTPEQHAAAIVIQRCFRRRCTGNNTTKSEGFYFKMCLAAMQAHSIPAGYYRALFLGPLPHILACLTAAETQILAIKAHLKQQLKIAENSMLDILDAQLTAAGKAHKRVKDFRGTLKPESKFHADRNVLALERAVNSVDEFIRALPATLNFKFALHDLEKDLKMGWRGIVAKSIQKRPVLPSLNTSDVSEL